MGGWWAVHENGPSDKYGHYYWDRKAKCTQTHIHTIKNSALIRDGGGRVIKMVPTSNIATTNVIEKTPNANPSYVKYRVEIVT